MSLSFPTNPNVNDSYNYEDKTWVWNGFAWNQINVFPHKAQLANVTSLSFELTGPNSTQPGTLAWNQTEDCLDIYQSDGTILQTGLEQYIRVHNMTGNTVENGKVVMFAGVMAPHNGSTEWVPQIELFDATNGNYPPLYVVGVTTDAIANGENGRVTTFGKVRHIDTSSWSAGDLLWASTTPGELTNVRPTAPDVAVSIAAVMKVDATEGEILVRPSIFPQLHMGTFYSNAQQTAAIANTPYAVTFNTNGLKCPHVNLANTDAIITTDQGLYKFEFRLHLRAPKNEVGRVWVWCRQDGVDVPDSATEMSLYGSGTIEATMYPSWAFQRSMGADSTFQLMWATDNTGIVIYQPATTVFTPASRSAAIRVTQVNL